LISALSKTSVASGAGDGCRANKNVLLVGNLKVLRKEQELRA
jgi:hypothetical protein